MPNLHGPSSGVYFFSSLATIRLFRIPMPSGPVDNLTHLDMAQRICFDPGRGSSFWFGDDRVRRMSEPFPRQRPLNRVQRLQAPCGGVFSDSQAKSRSCSIEPGAEFRLSLSVCTLILHGSLSLQVVSKLYG